MAARAYGPALVATGPATVYTVPAALKFVLRHVHINNPSGGAVTITLTIGADAAGTRLLGAYSVAAGAALDFYYYINMIAGEIITLSSGTNNVLNITIGGDLEAA